MIKNVIFAALAFTVYVPWGIAQEQFTDIHCGTVLDVEERNELRDQHILVRGDRIVAIGHSVDAPVSAVRIDLSDRVCAPGLMDMHIHLFIDPNRGLDVGRLLHSSAYNTLFGLRNTQTLLESGITTIRIPGDIGEYYEAVEIKNAYARGEFLGPRMLVAPHAISPIGGHADANSHAIDVGIAKRSNIVDGEDEIRRMVRKEIKYGADWIKVMATGGVMSHGDDPEVPAYTQVELNAFVDETHRHRKKIAAHAHGDAGARMAVMAGVDSIEHGTMLRAETIQLMAERGTWLVSTRTVLDSILEKGQTGGASADMLAKAKLVEQTFDTAIRMAYKKGVRMALGSDVQASAAIREFATMARILQDNWFVLRAGTISSAEMLELEDEIGSLKVGKLADIVAMPRSPLIEMSNIEEVNFVMKSGQVVRNEP